MCMCLRLTTAEHDLVLAALKKQCNTVFKIVAVTENGAVRKAPFLYTTFKTWNVSKEGPGFHSYIHMKDAIKEAEEISKSSYKHSYTEVHRVWARGITDIGIPNTTCYTEAQRLPGITSSTIVFMEKVWPTDSPSVIPQTQEEYRLLNAGEIVVEGDEYLFPWHNHKDWHPTVYRKTRGWAVKGKYIGCYRRKIVKS